MKNRLRLGRGQSERTSGPGYWFLSWKYCEEHAHGESTYSLYSQADSPDVLTIDCWVDKQGQHYLTTPLKAGELPPIGL